MEISLRKIKTSDAKYIAKILSNKEVLKTLDPKHPFPVPIDYVKNKIPLDKENWKKGSAYKFVILGDDKVVGQISLYNPDKNKKSYEVGYFIGYDYWNKGITTNAVKQIIEFGFKKLNLEKVWSVVPKRNPASIKVLKKAGF
ncbi:MAG: GNAT family N-acetyltransferase [Candidatus Pacearchaeota archaeon]|nr:GNAT family N-acetyltransferase [Candidatus Pacearchaeota archaeon]